MVDYSVLLCKLNNLGIHGVPFSWLGSYLSGSCTECEPGWADFASPTCSEGRPIGLCSWYNTYSPLY